jgi:pilus assembly protein FimV
VPSSSVAQGSVEKDLADNESVAHDLAEQGSAEQNSAAELTDPDDIDALLDSVNNETVPSSSVAQDSADDESVAHYLAEQNSAEQSSAAELTDPDDIDALLDSVNNEPVPSSSVARDLADNEPVKQGSAEQSSDEQNLAAELTDPDDIDALLDSVNNEPLPTSSVAQDLADNELVEQGSAEQSSAAELTDSDDIKSQQSIDSFPSDSSIAGSDRDSTMLSEEDLKAQQETNENQEKIAEFTAEYVTPFLTADFSDIVASSKEEKSEDSQATLAEQELDLIPNDDLDIDALLDNIQSEDLQSVDTDNDNHIEQARDELGDELITEVDNQVNAQGLSSEDLSQLLAESSDDETLEPVQELKASSDDTTDFSKEEVLAELLKESNTDDNSIIGDDALETIGDLDKVDFDDLLADIEQESANYVPEGTENNSVLGDIGDDLISEQQDNGSKEPAKPVEGSYVSVDDLLHDSLSDNNQTEPYEKENIDVGLGQFATNNSTIDVDLDGSMSAKLDLAKMYIEMSDEENAEVILHEVLLNGDNVQQVEAQSLLDTLKT